MKRIDILLTVLLLYAFLFPVNAQHNLEWEVTTQTTNASGNYTPLWLTANKYGLSSLQTSNGYVKAGVRQPLVNDSLRKWSIGYGISLAGAYNFTSPFIVQEAFGEVRWLKGLLTVGSKEQPLELKNGRLSSGSQTLGINARPVPQVRIELPDYWTFAHGWLGIKGHIAYGKTTDDTWQKDFTQLQSRYTEDVLYHSKAGYLRIGNPQHLRFNVELGLEMASFFGGTSYRRWKDGKLVGIPNQTNLKAYWNAFTGGGHDVGETYWQNVEGNMLGSWIARVNYDAPSWQLGVYIDHHFDDYSQMFFLDFDGYGEGENWMNREKNRYLLYDLKDIMMGAELNLRDFRWLNKIVVEYLYTKYQSGPIYHDHTQSIPDHLGGTDDYYNHHIYTGWQHWGMVIGNPLYMSPLYNTDGTIRIKNNRFVAWHAGISGNPTEEWSYRLLTTYQTGYGTYAELYPHPRHNFSLMAETSYRVAHQKPLGGWGITAAFGMDKGSLLGDNYGVQITLSKTGIINMKK